MTRVATQATEDTLLMIALHGSAHHVETVVRSYRSALEATELSRDELQQTNRSLTYHWDNDGSLILNGRFPAEMGALLIKALDVGIEKLSTDVSAETFGISAQKATRSMKRVDALSMVMESFIAHGPEAMSGGDKHQVVVHVAEETLKNREAGQCELEDGASIAAETCRRLACDCSLVHITEDENGNPLDVGRKTRSIPPALKRALNSRDKGCRFPGCCNKCYTHGHHVKHWANGGETKLGNLITLCYFHHRLVHEGGWDIKVLDDGAFRFLKPNGEALADNIPSAADAGFHPLALSLSNGSYSASRPAQWRGDKMDYHLAVQVLCQRETRARNPAVSMSAP